MARKGAKTCARQRVLTAMALVVVSCVVLFGGSIASAPKAHAATAPFGVASIATLLGGQNSDYQNDALAARYSGATWIRIVVAWSLVQPSSATTFDWTSSDYALTAALTHGLKPLVLLTGPAPFWAQSAGQGQGTPGATPANVATFGAFARAVATRYRPYVSTWEIWNEPNIPEFFNPVNVTKYATMLQAAYTNIKAVQPISTILSGGLSNTSSGVDAYSYITQLFNLGGGNILDGVALHPYTFGYKITEDPAGRAAVVPQTRDLMVSRGQPAKKIWITEYGQPTGTAPGAVSEAAQSAILTDFLQRTSLIDWLGPSFLYTTRDISTNPAYFDGNFGLYAIGYRPKAVVTALRGLIA